MAIGITQGQSVDPRGIDQGLEEFIQGRGGMSAFAPGKIEKGLATVGGGQMRDALTSAQDTYYNSLKDKDFNNPFSLSESEQAFIDNFDNRGDFRPPMDSNDVVGSQGYDFSPTPPPTRGIQHWTNPEDLAGMEAGSNEVAAAESIVPPQWDDFNNLPTDNAENIDVSMYPQPKPNFSPTSFGPPMPTGQGLENLWNILGRRYRSNPELDQQVFQEPNPAGGGIDNPAFNRMMANANIPGYQAPVNNDPSIMSNIGNSISNWWNNLNSSPSLNDKLAAAPVNINTNVPRPQTQDAVPLANAGDGFGEAGTKMDIPAPPPPTSGSVRMPTQGMSQVSGNPSPGFWQQILNRVSGKDPNKPFTGNPPPPSSGSVRMPTQNLGN
jgi:hypothetical protein